MADAIGIPVIIPHEQESVLLGAAIAGASASGLFDSMQDAMVRMGSEGRSVLCDAREKLYVNYNIVSSLNNTQYTIRPLA